MAGSTASSGTSQVPKEHETANAPSKTDSKRPRRQLTLIAITALLHLLLWSSIACIAITVYQIAARPDDTTNVPAEVLTLISVSVPFRLLRRTNLIRPLLQLLMSSFI